MWLSLGGQLTRYLIRKLTSTSCFDHSADIVFASKQVSKGYTLLLFSVLCSCLSDCRDSQQSVSLVTVILNAVIVRGHEFGMYFCVSRLDSSINYLLSDCTWDPSPGITFLCNNSTINRRTTFLCFGAVGTNLTGSHCGYLISFKVQNKAANIDDDFISFFPWTGA